LIFFFFFNKIKIVFFFKTEGSKVVVSVEFIGDPAPTVSWYRDGFMVEDSEDFKIHTTATESTLTIKHAFIIDSGLYTIKLFNPIGIRQCQAAIRIMPSKFIQDVSLEFIIHFHISSYCGRSNTSIS
jgi:hypothetical protein